MTVEELNQHVEAAYEAAMAYEDELAGVYSRAFERAGDDAVAKFRSTVVVAAGWVAPPSTSLTNGMTEEEKTEADSVRNHAATAIAVALGALGLGAVSVSFMQAISKRGQDNFEEELLLKIRNVVQKGLAQGWTADETATALQAAFKEINPTTAGMLAQTELTTLVNERSLQAALKTAENGEPLFKRWQTREDPRVRPAHAATQGQTVPVTGAFNVDGWQMMYPGDPTAPIRLVARCRCRMDYVDSLTASAVAELAVTPDVDGKAMVAVYPRSLEQRLLSVEGGENDETIHCTLIFLGSVADLDMEAVHETVAAVAADFTALVGDVGGMGFFGAGPDGFPMVALPDVQRLSVLREAVNHALFEQDIRSPSEHGWCPHITLAYRDTADDLDFSRVGESLHFETISVVVANERTDYRLGALVASAKEDTVMPMETATSTATAANLTAASITITIDESGDSSSEAQAAEPGAGWRALLALEGQPTEDGRMIERGALTWRDLPLTLMAMTETGPGGHEGAEVAGRIDRIYRADDDSYEIWGEGAFDTGEFGQEIQRMVGEQTLRGNSVDLAVTASEYRNAETGEVLEGDALWDAFFDDVPLLFVVLEGIVMASTVCPTPAIHGAEIMLASGQKTMWVNGTHRFQFAPASAGAILTASAAGMAPLRPPAAWFDNPELSEPTPLTVTPEGHVYGHAALWNTCHIAEPHGPGICVPPPRSGMSYSIFHHGALTTEEGIEMPVGQITMSTFHADGGLSWKAAMAHYEHSGCAVADVQAGEDRHGIWVSGAVRPNISAEQVRELKAGSLSGDWRDVIGRGLEFLSALVVNIPGFPIPRPEARIVASAAGEEIVLSLVAAGMVEAPEEVEGLSRREYLRKISALTRD